MAGWVKEVVVEAGGLSLIPGSHVVEGESKLPHVLSDLYSAPWHMCSLSLKHTQIHTQI